MTLTVRHWLLHHHVTLEFQGSMGKFVQLSTQIRTYRNCREGWWWEALCVCVCARVYTETQVSLRTDAEQWKHEKKKERKQINSSYCVGRNTWGWMQNSSLHIAQGWADSPCWTDLAFTWVHSSSVNLRDGEATKPNFWARRNSEIDIHESQNKSFPDLQECLVYLVLNGMEQDQAHILPLLVHLVSADLFLLLFLLLVDFWVLFVCISVKGQKVRNLDAAGFVWYGLERQLRWSPTCC